MPRIPSREEMEEEERLPPRRTPWGLFEQLEGRDWFGSPHALEPTLEPLRVYLARGGRLTTRLRAWLVEALSKDGESPVVVKIQRRRRGKPTKGGSTHNEIALFIIGQTDIGVKQESAIHDATIKYNISRSNAFDILRKYRAAEAETLAATELDPVFFGDTDEEE